MYDAFSTFIRYITTKKAYPYGLMKTFCFAFIRNILICNRIDFT
jgi:hypothetical protein